MSQDRAAEAAGTSQPTWARYESGDSRAFYDRLTVRTKALTAIGCQPRDLEAEVVAIERGDPFSLPPATDRFALLSNAAPRLDTAGLGVYEAAPDEVDLSRLLDRHSRYIRIVGDDLAPYVPSGGFAVYNLRGVPRRHDGVVIKLRGGAYLPRLFVRQGAGGVEVARFEARTIDGQPAFVRVTDTLPLFEVEGVYPIVLRGDYA